MSLLGSASSEQTIVVVAVAVAENCDSPLSSLPQKKWCQVLWSGPYLHIYPHLALLPCSILFRNTLFSNSKWKVWKPQISHIGLIWHKKQNKSKKLCIRKIFIES